MQAYPTATRIVTASSFFKFLPSAFLQKQRCSVPHILKKARMSSSAPSEPSHHHHHLSVNIQDLRKDYRFASLDVKDVESCPFDQFEAWLEQAVQSQLIEPNAMCIATASKDGRPSSRYVLLKGLDTEEHELSRGFLFFTNYGSRKGQELVENPFASLTFYWAELERSVRIEGKVEKLSTEESLAYFKSRPFGSQLGAWVSHQSTRIEDRSVLEKRYEELKAQYTGKEDSVPLPPFWGGFRVIPDAFEFWQGRSSRLHDRVKYELIPPAEGDKEKKWDIFRLSP